MQKFLICFAGILIGVVALRAEDAPLNSFSFGTSLRGTDGRLLADDTLDLQFSILMGSPDGPRVFREYHRVISDASGWISVDVGKGNKPLGLFSNIRWTNDRYFLNIALDTSGSKTFVSLTTTQIVVVPVIQVIEKEKTDTPVVEEVFSHFLGEAFEGGLIFHIYKDSAGTEHGLVVSLTDASLGSEWSNISSRFLGTNVNGMNGVQHTQTIMAQPGHLSSAAKICDDYSNGGYSDWYLPAIDELKLLWEAKQKIVKKLQADSQYPGQDLSLFPVLYWSSTEYNADEAMGFDFNTGNRQVSYKYNTNYVRAVRRF